MCQLVIVEDCRGKGQVTVGPGSQGELAPANPRLGHLAPSWGGGRFRVSRLLSALHPSEMPGLRCSMLVNLRYIDNSPLKHKGSFL